MPPYTPPANGNDRRASVFLADDPGALPAESRHLELDDLPRPEVTGRLHTHADAGGCPGGDDVPRFERDVTADEFDEMRDVEDEIRRAAVLAQVSIHSTYERKRVRVSH